MRKIDIDSYITSNNIESFYYILMNKSAKISCIREKSWFSHDSEFEIGGSHNKVSGETQYLGMNSFLNIFY